MLRKNPVLFGLLACLYCGFASSSSLFAASVTRGPYLQTGTPTGVTVCWRTDIATDSRVRYGTVQGNLDQSRADLSATTEHAITLNGLSADTTYFYAVGTTSRILAGNDAGHFFLTSPETGTSKPVRIWAIGDSGTGNNNARAVRDAYYHDTGTRHTDLWLMLGDNAYASGTDQEYQNAVFQNMYENMLIKSVLWPTLGNHDGVSADSFTQTGPYYDIFHLPTAGEAGGLASGTEAYYAFDYGNIHFVCLDSQESAYLPMLTWLDQDLSTTSQDWIIAFWHHPPYTKGSHDSDTERKLIDIREKALPILEAYGVDLVLGGHSHSYERSVLLDGHYGMSSEYSANPSLYTVDGGDGREDGDGAYQKPTLGPGPHEGTVYVVAGSSGKTSNAPVDHPVMLALGGRNGLIELGSMVLDINGNRMDAKFLNSNGTVRDYFTIIKDSGAIRDPAITIGMEKAVYTRNDTADVFTDVTAGSSPRLVDIYVVLRVPSGALYYLTPQLTYTPEAVPYVGSLNVIQDEHMDIYQAAPLSDTTPGDYMWYAALTDAGSGTVIGAIASFAWTVTP